MFFKSQQTCYRRLNLLHKARLVYREALPGRRGYMWSVTPERYTLKSMHDLGITEVYVRHHCRGDKVHFISTRVTFGSLKPDAYMETLTGKYAVEVDMGTNTHRLNRKLKAYVDAGIKVIVAGRKGRVRGVIYERIE